jgi:hypothetical protein
MPQPLQAKDDSDVSMSDVNMASQPTSSVRTTSRKRKAQEDLSQNPNTMKARKRNEAIAKDPIRLKIERAKAADQSAITVAKGKVVRSVEYMNAAPAKQHKMIQESAADVRLKRYFPAHFYTNLYTNLISEND